MRRGVGYAGAPSMLGRPWVRYLLAEGGGPLGFPASTPHSAADMSVRGRFGLGPSSGKSPAADGCLLFNLREDVLWKACSSAVEQPRPHSPIMALGSHGTSDNVNMVVKLVCRFHAQ